MRVDCRRDRRGCPLFLNCAKEKLSAGIFRETMDFN